MDTFEIVTQYVAPALGAILANLLFLGPYSAIKTARRLEDLGPINPILFPFIMANCLGYVSYGFLRKDIFLILANIFGVNIAIFYLITSFRLSKAKSLVRRLELLTIVLLLFWSVLLSAMVFVEDFDLKVDIVGYCALSMTLCMFAAPLSTIAQVLKERNTASINKGFLTMQLLSCTAWATYGFVMMDLSILIGNVVGLLTGSVQAFLVLTLPRQSTVALPIQATQPMLPPKLEDNISHGPSSFYGSETTVSISNMDSSFIGNPDPAPFEAPQVPLQTDLLSPGIAPPGLPPQQTMATIVPTLNMDFDNGRSGLSLS